MTTTLWLHSRSAALASAASSEARTTSAASFAAVEVGPPSGAIATRRHLAVDLDKIAIDQLPLRHLLSYCSGDGSSACAHPIVGLRLERKSASAEGWQLAADLTIEAHQPSVAREGASCTGTLVPAGFVAFEASSPAEVNEGLALLTGPAGAIAGKRGYVAALGSAYDERRKAVLLDRDGVINVDTGYGHRPEDFQWVPGVLPFLRTLQSAGWQLVIVTNQAGVAKGKFPMAVAEDYHRYIVAQLASEGVTILASALCPYHKDGSEAAYRCASIYRKPMPGMALQLAEDHRLALQDSIMIGDKDSDRLRLPGLRPFIIQGRYPLSEQQPHYQNFAEILAALPT